MKFRIEHAYEHLSKDHWGKARKLLEDLSPVLQRTMDETRVIYMGLRPRMLEDLGLLATLYWFRDEYLKLYPQIHVEIKVALDEYEVPQHLAVVIFRIVQEALNNTAKHAKAEWVDLTLAKSGNTINLEIIDDGIGMELSHVLASCNSKSLGLEGMRERAEITGGRFSIESTPGEGTAVRVCWPMEKENTKQPAAIVSGTTQP